ncbi:MAG: hypothetical protein L7F78_11025, partial [Syntrophales bacterium LBB04]|nr:hypothetical protein [Syntrophales bacterium LBB04]
MLLFEDVKKILLVQLGDIGDLVWMTPALRAVKEAYREAEVSLLVREGNGALLEGDPAVGKIFEIKKIRGSLYTRLRDQLRFLRDLHGERFAMVIDFRADERGAIMTRLSGAPIRVAQGYPDVPFWRNRCFTHLVYPPPRERVEPGAAEQSLRIVRELGIEPQATVPRLRVREAAERRARELLQGEGIDGPDWCSINPFSRWSYKELPQGKWA